MMTRADWVLIVAVVCSLPLLYTHFWFTDDVPAYLRIQAGRENAAFLPLAPDRLLQIEGPLGDSTVEIRDGQARFTSSPCPGKHCIHTGWLKTGGALAACLPNRISIQLLGRDNRYDAINF